VPGFRKQQGSGRLPQVSTPPAKKSFGGIARLYSGHWTKNLERKLALQGITLGFQGFFIRSPLCIDPFLSDKLFGGNTASNRDKLLFLPSRKVTIILCVLEAAIT